MHAETLAYMLHRLPYDRKSAPAGAPQLTPAPVRPGMVQVPAGLATLGLSRNGDTFGWDNEFERHTVDVDAFAIDRYKTTNSEYLEFINSRGYDNRTLWSDADWAWKESNRIRIPRSGVEMEPVALEGYVRRDSAAAGLAGLREPRRGQRLCALGWEELADRGAMAACGVWRAGRPIQTISVGIETAQRGARQL